MVVRPDIPDGNLQQENMSMFRTRNTIIAALAGLASLLLGASTAQASYTIDFDVPAGASGSIGYAGNGGTLSGTNLTVNQITSSNPNVSALTVTGGLLNFATSNYIGTDANGDLFFATIPTSSITITGTTTATGGTTTQLTGTLTGTAEVINLGGGVLELVETAVFSPTSPAVAAYFGDSTTVPYVGTLGILFSEGATGLGSGGNGFSSGLISSGNVAVVPTPAPSGVVLAGFGACFCLLGYAVRRRQVSAAAAAA
jgi:hypothetical protein